MFFMSPRCKGTFVKEILPFFPRWRVEEEEEVEEEVSPLISLKLVFKKARLFLQRYSNLHLYFQLVIVHHIGLSCLSLSRNMITISQTQFIKIWSSDIVPAPMHQISNVFHSHSSKSQSMLFSPTTILPSPWTCVSSPKPFQPFVSISFQLSVHPQSSLEPCIFSRNLQRIFCYAILLQLRFLLCNTVTYGIPLSFVATGVQTCTIDQHWSRWIPTCFETRVPWNHARIRVLY